MSPSMGLVDQSDCDEAVCSGNRDAPAGCISWLPVSLFVLPMSGLGSVHDFYRRSVAISDPCCHSTISVH